MSGAQSVHSSHCIISLLYRYYIAIISLLYRYYIAIISLFAFYSHSIRILFAFYYIAIISLLYRYSHFSNCSHFCSISPKPLSSGPCPNCLRTLYTELNPLQELYEFAYSRGYQGAKACVLGRKGQCPVSRGADLCVPRDAKVCALVLGVQTFASLGTQRFVSQSWGCQPLRP